MQMWSTTFMVTCLFLASSVIISSEARGRPPANGNSIGEYGPQNVSPKPYSFNYEVKDEYGNTHYRKEQGDPSGAVMGSYGYMNVNGLYRMVEYMADAAGFKARVKTNEPGSKGPGSADVEVQADPVPQGLVEMFDRKAPAGPSMGPPVSRPSYPGMKG